MFFHPRGSSQTGPCLWGSHSGVNNRQEGEKTKHNHKRLASKDREGPGGWGAANNAGFGGIFQPQGSA